MPQPRAPQIDYNDYELGNARIAAQSMMPNPYPQTKPQPVNENYDEYELGNERIAQSIAQMANSGRGTDTMVAHVTPGDYVVPRAVIERDPAILSRIKKNFDEEGVDYRDHMVGHEMNNINPETGQPEFGWFKKIKKFALPILGAVAGGVLGGPAGAAAGSAAGTKLAGGSFKDAAISAGGTYLGGQFLGGASGDVAGNLTQNSITRPIGESLANGTFGSIGNALGSASYGTLAGALQGQSLAGMASSAMTPMESPQAASYSVPQENLDVGTPNELSLPGTLNNLGGLSDIQRTSQIATQGAEGTGGVSKEGQDYFINQVRRRLTTEPASNLLPIEGSYLNRLGVNFQQGNTKSILEGIARSGLNA